MLLTGSNVVKLEKRSCLASRYLGCRCEPNKPATTEQLRKLGVLQWQLNADNHENDPKLKAIRAVRNYSYQVRLAIVFIYMGLQAGRGSVTMLLLQDVITIQKDTLPNYEEKLKSFFEEHLHTDEEIRYILEGSGVYRCPDIRVLNHAFLGL